MAADHFCLRWNNYQNNMVSELDILRTEEYLVDVTLCCEGFKFRAHKVILSACSPYFRNVFKENPCEHPVVILKDVHPEDVEALLSFVYQGVVYVSEKKLSSFLQTAELLQIKGLAGAASSFDAATSKFNSSLDGPVKRRKGAPVRIVKQEDSGEEAGGVQLEAEDDGTNEEMDVSKHDEDGSIGEESESENSGDVCGAMYNSFQIKDEFMAVNPLKNESVSNLIHQNFESRQHTPLTPNQIQNQSTTPQGQAGIESQGQGSYQISNTPNHGMSDLLSSAADRNGRRPCPQCTKVISNKSNLLKHIRIRHSDAYNPACCVLCKKIFKNKYSLRAHLNIYHKEYISPVPTQQQQTQQQQLVTPPPSLEVQQQQPQQTQLQPQQHLAQSPAHPTFPTTPTTGNQQYSIPS